MEAGGIETPGEKTVVLSGRAYEFGHMDTMISGASIRVREFPELAAVTESVEAYFSKCKSAFPAVHATSSEKGIGIAELRAILAVF